MTKVVFLILYLWHASEAVHDGQPNTTVAMNGGAILHFERMPSLEACETVGMAAKELADRSMPNWEIANYHHLHSLSPPASYRCVEVVK